MPWADIIGRESRSSIASAICSCVWEQAAMSSPVSAMGISRFKAEVSIFKDSSRESRDAQYLFELPFFKPHVVERHTDIQTEVVLCNHGIDRGRPVYPLCTHVDVRAIVPSVDDRDANTCGKAEFFGTILSVDDQVRRGIVSSCPVSHTLEHVLGVTLGCVFSTDAYLAAVRIASFQGFVLQNTVG